MAPHRWMRNDPRTRRRSGADEGPAALRERALITGTHPILLALIRKHRPTAKTPPRVAKSSRGWVQNRSPSTPPGAVAFGCVLVF